MIVIIDYNMGNIGSIRNMINEIGYNIIISNKKEIIKKATKLILPGVGAFDQGMTNLINLDILNLLNEKVLVKHTPILGICLGMQLMTLKSQEGEKKGLGWINAEVIKFNFNNKNLKIPHMGWNFIKIKKKSPLFTNMKKNKNRFYFVHSYHVICNNIDDILTETNYGYNFVSSFEHNNIIGVQFHPEKSHKFGMQLLKNFLEYY